MQTPRALFAIVATFAVAVSASAALPFPPEKERWVTVNAAEFHIFSNASDRETQQIATNLLRMREAVGKVTQLTVRSPMPMNVFVFRNERAFAPFRDAIFQRRNATVTGGFLAGQSANYVVLQSDVGEGADRVVFHELTHYFLRNTVAGLPLWFNEGMAEYYSTFTTSGDNVNIGKAIPEHVAYLRDGNTMPLPQLFAIDVHSPDYGEGRRQGAFYAESWALIHYLLAGNPERRPQLLEFLALLRAGKPVDDAFTTAFKAKYIELERELRNYLNRPSMTYTRYSLDELKIPEVPAPQPIARDQVLFALGDLLAHANASTVADAQAFLAEAIRVNGKNAEAHATLGYVDELLRDRPAATAEYEKAVALGSSNPESYILYGASMLDRLSQNVSGPGGVSQPDVKRARELFARAVQLDSSSARAYAGLGATYVLSTEDPAPGIAMLEKSLTLGASQEDVAMNLIQLYGRAGKRDDAQRTFDTYLANSTDPERVREGREAVLFADVERAQSLLREHKYAEAMPLMHGVIAATTNDALKQHLQGVVTSVEDDMKRQQQFAVVKSAVEKANAGRIADALQLVDQLLPEITDPELKTHVEKLRADLAKSARRK